MMETRIVQLKTNPLPGYVYLISAVGTGIFKIGKTQKNVLTRLKGLQTGSPIKLRYVYHVYVENVNVTEIELHRRFSGNRQIGEWFSLTPTEVKECILLMRLVSIQAEHFTEIETEIEDDLETELEPEIETTIEQETEIEERFGTLMLTKSEAVELIERLLKTLNKTQIIERIWGCTRGGSKAYRQAHAEFQNLIGKNDRE